MSHTQVMKTTKKNGSVIRLSGATFKHLQQHLSQNPRIEQFAFGLFDRRETSDGPMLIVRDLYLPDKDDLSSQSAGGVTPSREFQAQVYAAAANREMGIIDFHTHPHQGTPRFSGIDTAEAAQNADYICRKLPEAVGHAMVVFGNDLTGHDAVVLDRASKAYRPAGSLEILGRGIQIRPTRTDGDKSLHAERYDRQQRIPGWDQRTLSHLKVFIVGAGGNGAQIFQTLVSLGVGEHGWIAVADDDQVEATNLPRIPYAFAEHVGVPKVTVAAQYAGRKNPSLPLYPYALPFQNPAVIARAQAAHLLILAPDNDGARKIGNELAVDCQIPMIDMACDILIDKDKVESGGQVRLVLPSENACLVCCGAYDPSEAALDLMDEESRARHAGQGYVRGAEGEPTASVANLNAFTAQLGMSAFLAVVHGRQFGDWDYCHFNQFTAQTVPASTQPNDRCPLCSAHTSSPSDGQEEKPTAPDKQAVPEEAETATTEGSES